jgi:dihydroorotate dehydrogenase (NAD+) catalytic subunit
VNIEFRIGKTSLETPLIGASGLFGYGTEYEGLVDYSCFGAVVAKTVTPEPREGNCPERIADVGCGIINSIGLENVGGPAFFGEVLPAIDIPCGLFVSIGGATVDDYRRLAAMAGDRDKVDAIEVNISCPNVKEGGIAFGSDPKSTHRVISAVRAETRLPLVAKVPPAVTGIEEICLEACEAGVDALTVANTYPAMSIDTDRSKPRLGAVSGGLSGRAIKPMTMLLVWKVSQAVDVPVIASGGIETAGDAIEYVLAGASAFEIGSVILRDLAAPSSVIEGLKSYMRSRGYDTLADFRGKANRQEAEGGSGSDTGYSGS